MNEINLAALSKYQFEAMRLVAQGYKTKEIAYLVGAKESAVNARIDEARAKFGNVSRAEAGRMFAVAMQALEQHGLLTETEKIQPDPETIEVVPADPSIDPFDAANVGGVQERKAGFVHQQDLRLGELLYRLTERPVIRLVLWGNVTLLLLIALALLKPSSESFGWIANLVAPSFQWRKPAIMSNETQPVRRERRAAGDEINKAAALAAIARVGGDVVAGTKAAEEGVIRTARAVASFVEQRPTIGVSIDLGNGPEGALSQLYKALGSALQFQDDQIASRLTLFGMTYRMGFDFGENCPCGEGPPPSGEIRTGLTVVGAASGTSV